MSEIRVKETMEQIHISEEMQERIIQNIQDRMDGGLSMERERSRSGSSFWRKKTAVAAAIVLAVGALGIPAQAIVRSFVMARMEEIPRVEVKDIVRLLQAQRVEADSFSRELSDSEHSRMKELWQLYRNGMFPEATIRLVEYGEEMPEGIFCYVFETGYFNLPEREMTDEELLQIIDFNMLRNYALSQTPAGQEARREQQTRQDELRRQVAEEGGISREEAVEIATAQMEYQLGPQAVGTKYSYVYLSDISKEDYAHKSDVAYIVVLRPAEGGASYVCRIDSRDGNILEAGENLPFARNILDE